MRTFSLMIAFLWLCGFLFYPLKVVAGDTLIMPVQAENLAPFKYWDGEEPAGIEVDLARAIAKEISSDIEFRKISIAQGRKAFEQGTITLDCCLNEIWFPRDEAKAVQLFSAPLYRLLEIWIFPKGRSFKFDSVKALKNKTVIGIKGFNYPGEEHYGKRIDGNSPLEVMEMLLAGEGDVAVLERHVASYLINKHHFPAEFGELYYAVNVSLRLHKSQEKQLPLINKAIIDLKARGEIQAIIKKNLR